MHQSARNHIPVTTLLGVFQILSSYVAGSRPVMFWDSPVLDRFEPILVMFWEGTPETDE